MTEFNTRNLKPLVVGLDALARGSLYGFFLLLISLAATFVASDTWFGLGLLGTLACFLLAAAGPFVCLLSPFPARYRVAMALAPLLVLGSFALALAPQARHLGGLSSLLLLSSGVPWLYSLWGLTRVLEVPPARWPLLGSLLLFLPVPFLAGAAAMGEGDEWMVLAWSLLSLVVLIHWRALSLLSRAANRKMAELRGPEPQPLGFTPAG